MSIEQMIAQSYGHFLKHFSDPEKAAPIFLQYAIEELNLSGDAALQYTRPILTDVEDEIASDKFDHFYIWYFVNYMTHSQDSTLLN